LNDGADFYNELKLSILLKIYNLHTLYNIILVQVIEFQI